MSQPWRLRETIPSDPDVGRALVMGLLEAMEQLQWPAPDMFRVQLAFEEAIVNAIRHGNKLADDKTVQVEMDCDHDQIRIQITDQGDGFDPGDVPDPRQDDLLEVPGGRGVLLINEIMSDVSYNDIGNQITMVKVRGDDAEDDDAEEDDADGDDD
ncbi:MAG: ATP-binding protein [Planctomycetota bacterium]